MATSVDDPASVGDSSLCGYAEHLKPRVFKMLHAVGLDVVYHRAEGDQIYYRNNGGEEVEVLDAVGGFGASLFGHNNPRLVARARQILDEKRPFLAQASIRGYAGELATRLSSLVGRTTGRSYIATLASTGSEAVEAAIKHSEMELIARIEAVRLANREVLTRFRQLPAEQARVSPELAVMSERHSRDGDSESQGNDERSTLTTFGAAVEKVSLFVDAENETKVATRPAYFALRGAFHGKSTGALSLTANEKFREHWFRIGMRVVFLPVGNVDALRDAIQRNQIELLSLVLGDDGMLRMTTTRLVNVAAFFFEPIQGEGGARELPADYVNALGELLTAAKIPIVIDEIQTGMGRTGSFLASEPFGIRGDYYLFSKSLGASLAKISALLVDRERYVEDFGFLHTSTFAEDDYASAVALEALNLLEENGGAIMAMCREKGAYFLKRVREIQSRYPDQIVDVRGRGLMLGVEFAKQDRSASPFLRAASEQGLLGYLVAGYLLRVHQIRVAPTLSAAETLRIQPSAYIDFADLDRVASAIEAVAELLRVATPLPFASAVLGKTPSTPTSGTVPVSSQAAAPEARGDKPSTAREAIAPTKPFTKSEASTRRKVAFLGHFLEPGDLRDWEPSFAPLTNEDCDELLRRVRGIFQPFVLDNHIVRSTQGAELEITIIGVPFTSAQVMDGFQAGQTGWARADVQQGVDLARELGCEVIGFGGYTSIVTNNCRAIVDERSALTTGNALTAAASIRGVLNLAAKLNLGPLRVGVVGALGNIGHVLAELLSEHAEQLILLGRPGGGERRLVSRAEDLCLAAYRRSKNEEHAEKGIARRVRNTETTRALEALLPNAPIPSELRERLFREMENAVVVSSDLKSLRACNVIVSASNSSKPILFSEHFGDHPVLVSDVAVPGDVDASVFRDSPNVTVVAGGRVKLPFDQRIRLPGASSTEDQIFGCLAETLALGFENIKESFAVGALTPEHVRRAESLAKKHGFSLEGEMPSAASKRRH